MKPMIVSLVFLCALSLLGPASNLSAQHKKKQNGKKANTNVPHPNKSATVLKAKKKYENAQIDYKDARTQLIKSRSQLSQLIAKDGGGASGLESAKSAVESSVQEQNEAFKNYQLAKKELQAALALATHKYNEKLRVDAQKKYQALVKAASKSRRRTSSRRGRGGSRGHGYGGSMPRNFPSGSFNPRGHGK